jgi:hypothetical protein
VLSYEKHGQGAGNLFSYWKIKKISADNKKSIALAFFEERSSIVRSSFAPGRKFLPAFPWSCC